MKTKKRGWVRTFLTPSLYNLFGWLCTGYGVAAIWKMAWMDIRNDPIPLHLLLVSMLCLVLSFVYRPEDIENEADYIGEDDDQ